MFGVSRKKAKPKQVRSAALDDDDDDDVDDANHRAQQQLRSRHNKKRKVKGEKEKRTTTAMLSFDPDEGLSAEDDEHPSVKFRKRKKDSRRRKHRTSGLGFGGINAPSDGSTSEGEEESGDDNGGQTREGSCYDKSALEKLRREQKRTATLMQQDDEWESEQIDATLNQDSAVPVNDNAEEAFIPLPSGTKNHSKSSYSPDPVVLTGDEAMALADQEQAENDVEFDHGLQSPPTPPPISTGEIDTDKTKTKIRVGMDMNFDEMDTGDDPSNDVEEGNRRWEDTMVRRAGVLPPKAASTDGDGSHSRPQRTDKNQATLGQIRASLSPTITNLEHVYADLESSINRHETSINSARDELTRNKFTLEKHGQALEYYQGLREDLATWMGALRELDGMVKKAEEARRVLEAEVTIRRMERFLEWGNDCAEVLEKQGLLTHSVMKEQTRLNASNDGDQSLAQVDEFGRDISTLSSITRIKRWNQRRKRCLKRLQDSHPPFNDESKNPLEQSLACSNVDNFDSAEIEEWKHRRDVLEQALAIIPELVKDEYLSISNLCSFFFDWKRLQPEDYTSCYADVTLIQMIEVLARLELCERWDVFNLAESSSSQCRDVTEFKWFRAIKESGGGIRAASQPTASIALEVIGKQIVTRILNSFSLVDETKSNVKQCGIYDPFSEIQTMLLCDVVKSIFRCIGISADEKAAACEQMAGKLLNALLALVRSTVKKIGVPIVDASKITLIRNKFVTSDNSMGLDNETTDAITYATVVQANELTKLAKNILGHWYPIFKQELRHQHQYDDVTVLVRYVLEDLVSIRILPALHLLHGIISSGSENNEEYVRMPRTVVSDIMDTIQGKAMLDPAEWMLMLAPLRAAVRKWDDKSN